MINTISPFCHIITIAIIKSYISVIFLYIKNFFLI
nr:MAG TPA: hypothetical protein [Caudoviricetes sp.]DAZ23705.1 MAG TPA: hypothetical protein [Caudoviricetes sp.]